ncbi:hypothetical protein MTY59_24130 [Mycobacterium senriense]|uniref:Uncharacterized protein n=1 Tax=Mycobacterium senriense TaxID=2775496 RepID=A0ABM7SMN8_9MYCO|nr:hypothetical protein MTY59_24130 [Mycobacterium senriense]
MQSVQHIGAGLIQGGGEDVQISGQGRTDFHHGMVPLGAPERGSNLPGRTGKSPAGWGTCDASQDPSP